MTDIDAGYDHVACAIGGAVAGEAGADFYVLEEDVCTMCGKYCAIKQVQEYFKGS